MHIKTARKLVLWTMVLSIACAVVGLLFFPPGSVGSMYITLAAFGLMAASLVILFGLCRCPWCSKTITNGLLKAEYCPHCKRDFDTGLRYKKKRR